MTTAAGLMAEGRRRALSGGLDEGVHLLHRALALDPAPEIRETLTRILRWSRRFDEADAVLAAGLADRPDHPGLRALAGEGALRRRRPTEAAAHVAAASAMTADLWRIAGSARLLLTDPAGAVVAWERGRRLDPADWRLAGNILYAANCDPAMTTAGLRRRQDAVFAGMSWPRRPAPRPRAADGRLHIGYVGGCFTNHAAARVVLPMIMGHDRSRFRITCYPTLPAPVDPRLLQLRLAVDGWRGLAGLDDAAAADLIRADGIDVLVDLDGHVGGNRIGIFARRPAALQIQAWGYLPGTGLPVMDGLVTDPVLLPPAERADLPASLATLDVPCPTLGSPLAAPPDADPRIGADVVRLGCPARLEKLPDSLLEAFAAILDARPATVLVLQDDLVHDPAIGARLDRWQDRHRLAPGRVERLARGVPDYLTVIRSLDLALDTSPYSGGVVTLDLLSQGVPVVTMGGGQACSRTTASILACLGPDGLVAEGRDAWIGRVLALIDDAEARRALRAELRATHIPRLAAASPATIRAVEAQLLSLAGG
ncbi:O-linked N-acetylglucosamine transferase (plasmid) [Tistrella mobilis]|uniref:O-linked N-acetylglucosamine transferase family protein n=1 Tax=Tistrella mobilis TaxID=171437 RepID=UPI003558F28B